MLQTGTLCEYACGEKQMSKYLCKCTSLSLRPHAHAHAMRINQSLCLPEPPSASKARSARYELMESPFHFTVDVLGWARHINFHAPSDHWLHTVAYVIFAGIMLLSWKVIQKEIKKQHRD